MAVVDPVTVDGYDAEIGDYFNALANDISQISWLIFLSFDRS